MKQFSVKRPAETVTLNFRYTKDLASGETLLPGTMVVTAATWKGTDPSPAAILQGVPAVVGDRVLQQVTGGLDRVQYLVVAQVTTSAGNTLQLEGILPVENPR